MSSLVQYIPIKAKEPSLHDNTADLDRLRNHLKLHFRDNRPIQVPFSIINSLTRSFRQAGFRGYALVNDLIDCWQVVDFAAKKREVLLGMALDLGTTHLEASLVNLLSGEVLNTGDLQNNQIQYGADILSRIHHATGARRRLSQVDQDFFDPGLEELRTTIIRCVNDLAIVLARDVADDVDEIRALSVSGNTTMVHLFAGLDPYHICREPYIPMVNKLGPVAACELKLEIHPNAPVWVMPSVGSFFGGDLISGIVASGMTRNKETRMLIDVGTNAEVVLGNSEWLIGCAGAAGPALEGGVARMGMRAGPGAIESVSVDCETFTLTYATIGDVLPCGICGSGLIDLVASLYLCQIIDIRGRFRDAEKESHPQRAKFMRQRYIERQGQLCFTIVFADEAHKGRAVILEQVDLDSLIRSKAAMYAILTTLTSQVGHGFSELEEIYVAGTFGRHINPRSAVTLGMLPDLDESIYKVIGNSSLAGAEKALMDEKARRDCIHIVQTITYLELNVNHEFMIRFSGSKFIPHTDPDLFPSVPFFNREK